jgi:hypothetical protein
MCRLIRWSVVAVCLVAAVIGVLLLIVRIGFGYAFRFEPAQAAVAVDTGQPGLTYTNQRVARVPWSIHVLKIDRARTDLGFFSAHARGKVLGVSLIGQQARSVPRELGKAVAGVNGDFYLRDNPTYAGDPRGLQIVDGELISGPDSACVWFDAKGSPHLDEVKADFTATWPDGTKIRFGLNERRTPSRAVLYTPTYGPSTRAAGGQELILEKEGDGPWVPLRASQTYRARVREVSTAGNTRLSPEIMVLSLGPRLVTRLPAPTPGTVIELTTATTPDLADAKAAIGGGPALLKDGEVCDLRRPSSGSFDDFSERSKFERHPRSALGWSPTHIYLVVVDGRQPRLSMGMTLAELAQYFARMGCTDAMNFDGGKSAQMWLNGRILNSPCHGEDTVANSLLVVRKGGGD